MNCKEFGRLTGAKYDKMFEQSKRIYSTDGLSPTIHTMQGGNTEAKIAIQKIDIPQTVKVRKYPIDCKSLCECLRDYKSASNFTNKEIAEQLDRPLTEVEHWFRNDQYFSIPDENIWFALKELLGIETTCFDESIMTFEEREGVYEKSERHYFSNGLSPTLTSMSGSEKIIVPQDYRIRKLTPKECWRLMGFDDADFDKAEKVCSNTQLYKQAGNSIVVNVLEGILDALLPKQSRSEWLDELLGDV